MLDRDPIFSILALGVILLLPIILFFRLQWNSKITQSTGLSSRLRLWNRRPAQSSNIVSLRVYPIKSCRGFEVRQTTLKEHGLDLDRQWMIVDASTHEFLTIRQIQYMTLINTSLSADGQDLVITIPTSFDADDSTLKTVSIPAHPSPEWLAENTTVAAVKIWDTDTDGYIYNEEVNAPFSAFLGCPVALVYKGPTPRTLKGNGAAHILGRVQSTGFPDVFPILIASEASLAELNSRLRGVGVDPITIERFRPNIIVRGQTPWIEDSWKLVQISGSEKNEQTPLVLDIVARCTRCQVPNVDPDTATKHKKQPWDMLVSYRRVDEGIKFKPCFGMLSAPRSEGPIEVGMKLEVLEETTQHRYIRGF
ncbi:Molybdenum cofactor sulfurase C-terminal [Penicillium taxi]|uniref:Molybdenum cofactor sulfurase C-terminal n=1 Tax=Penicillium taxi TaxID=168475 RepID=UPI002545B4E8|nr:Molybdenum cofactor sulfurase C-terminal [Penicillium taxi]KAJ5908860.1 Molybdenum cofactor sulfurase C-terminal [Penicillium taxi]